MYNSDDTDSDEPDSISCSDDSDLTGTDDISSDGWDDFVNNFAPLLKNWLVMVVLSFSYCERTSSDSVSAGDDSACQLVDTHSTVAADFSCEGWDDSAASASDDELESTRCSDKISESACNEMVSDSICAGDDSACWLVDAHSITTDIDLYASFWALLPLFNDDTELRCGVSINLDEIDSDKTRSWL